MSNPLSAYSELTSLTGAQRRAMRAVIGGERGWRMIVTPSTGPAEQLELYRPGHPRHVLIGRDGSVEPASWDGR